MSKKIYGHLQLQNAQELRYSDSDSSHYAGLKSPGTITTSYSLALPTADAAGVMKSDGSGQLSLAKISNADIDAAAAISFSKMENLSNNFALQSNGSGDVSVSSVTSTELGYVSGVTSSIQTQFSGKLTSTLADGQVFIGNGSNIATANAVSGDIAISNTGVTSISAGVIVNADINASAAIAYSKLNLASSIVNADINASAAIAESKLALDFSTSSLNTAIGTKAGRALDNLTVASMAQYDLLVASSATAVSRLGVGSNGQVLKVVAGAPAWAADSAGAYNASTWANADGASKVVTHSLGTKDVIVQIYDTATDETIEIDSVQRNSTSQVTLTASQAPGTNWRVLVMALA